METPTPAQPSFARPRPSDRLARSSSRSPPVALGPRRAFSPPRATPRPAETALDRYVAKPDDAYRFTRVSVLEGDGYRAHVLELVSQRWRNPWEVDRTEWHHWLTIIVPAAVRHRTALLWIGGGDNDDPAPTRAVGALGAPRGLDRKRGRRSRHGPQSAALLRRLAEGRASRGRPDRLRARQVHRHRRRRVAGAPGDGEVGRARHGRGAAVPAQPRWRRGRDRRLRRRRRVEAGMDHLAGRRGRPAGVRAIVPGGHRRAQQRGDHPPPLRGLRVLLAGARRLRPARSVSRTCSGAEPCTASSRSRIPTTIAIATGCASIPKLLVNAAGDQFFLPDNSRFYFADLQGEKHLRYVPNAKHDLAGSDAQDTILAFYRAVLEDRPRPRFTWRTLEDETIVVTAQDRPQRGPAVAGDQSRARGTSGSTSSARPGRARCLPRAGAQRMASEPAGAGERLHRVLRRADVWRRADSSAQAAGGRRSSRSSSPPR